MIKVFHLLFLFTWLGTLLSSTRLIVFYAKESIDLQKKAAAIYWRAYSHVELPAMCLALFFGIMLFAHKPQEIHSGWFHMKLTFAFLLVICDLLSGLFIFRAYSQTAIDASWGLSRKAKGPIKQNVASRLSMHSTQSELYPDLLAVCKQPSLFGTGLKFRVLHYLAAFFLISILVSIYVIHRK